MRIASPRMPSSARIWDDSGFLVIAEIGLAWTDTVQSYGQREGWSNSCSGVQPCQSPLRVPTLSYPFDGSTVGSRDRLNDSSRLRILVVSRRLRMGPANEDERGAHRLG